MHYHLAGPFDEHVFLIAFRTMPQDSTGVAHILEHTALCGSERFPVRDPFFMMTRRSLNTFMNAFTSSDWTAYPFASCNRKDYFNLLEVYVDAVFFPTLDPLDFAQEGHRLEFEKPDDPSTPLTIRGVVYNEMKGAMSSPVSQLWQRLTHHLYPTTTYHYNSGGEPDEIPDLDWEGLKAFHARHYHPGNALVMTFGDLEAGEIQSRLQTLALHRFEETCRPFSVPREKRYFSPVRVEEGYAATPEPGKRQDHVVMGWLLGDATDLEGVLEGHLLSNVLLDNSASPLMHVLETTDLGDAPSPLCGYEDGQRETLFACGLEGARAEDSARIESLILDELRRIAEEGVPQEKVEAVLHQLELSQREITGDGYPFGLHLILAALPYAVHGADPAQALDLDSALQSLREKVRDPAYVPGLVRRWLLDNPHRVTLTLRADGDLAQRRDVALAEMLVQRKAAMSDDEKKGLVEQARILEARQNAQPDADCLPKVTAEDVPRALSRPQPAEGEPEGVSVFERGTNGLVYARAVYPLPVLDAEQYPLLTWLPRLMGELGAGSHDYLSLQQALALKTGGVRASGEIRQVCGEEVPRGYLSLTAKALARNREAMADLMHEVAGSTRFDENDRLRDLLSQERARRLASVIGSGHSYAMMAAAAALNPLAALSHTSSGLAGLQELVALDTAAQSGTAAYSDWRDRLTALHQVIMKQSPELVLVGESESVRNWSGSIAADWTPAHWKRGAAALDVPKAEISRRQAWVTATQVNFCAMAVPSVTSGHPDQAALLVLGNYLRNNWLHRVIREQGGAYGGGASQDSATGVFRFFSYRDPRLTETLDDFRRAIDWVLDSSVEAAPLEEAILGVISALDKPRSPAGEALAAHQDRLFGRTDAFVAALRDQVLNTAGADLQRVAQTWLATDNVSLAVVTSAEGAEVLASQGYERYELKG
ncbi:MAG: peptidase M16 [Gammaproteobacteria bacterium]|nr:MAG: peptidase M16 [Gammaproteobacteria bacterium]